MNPTNEQELRDYDQYFIWNTVYLLRTLGVMKNLTPLQKKIVEEDCKLRAATIREDITQQTTAARIDEIRRTRPHLTYPGMVYYGERMNELRGAETEEVK